MQFDRTGTVTLTEAVLTKITKGLTDVARQESERPITLSASFLLYRLKIEPVYASENLELLVNSSVSEFNAASSDDIASAVVEGPDFHITIDKIIDG